MAQYTATIDLATLNGANGFRIDGLNVNDHLGRTVSVGDINGDGLLDIVVGAPYVQVGLNGNVGTAYVVFGQAGSFSPTFDVTTLDGTNGFRLDGLNNHDYTGYSVSAAGDINGDGFNDLIIGATHYGPGNSGEGRAYVVFGKSGGFSAGFDLASLNGSNGFTFESVPGAYLGHAVASAGDVNGDGVDDLIVGATTDANGHGRAYVVFGHTGPFGIDLDLTTLNGTNGFSITGEAALDQAGISVESAGDVNGDGFNDLLIGAIEASNGISAPGAAYLVFGKASGFPTNIDLSTLNGTNGFKFTQTGSPNPAQMIGSSVASAGDVNGDGYGDIIVGGDHDYTGGHFSGRAYVVFGKAGGFGAVVDVTSLNGTNGFAITGGASDESLGNAVTHGDVNGDGFSDLIVGAYGTNGYTGSVHVIFGKASGFTADINADSLDGTNGFIVPGLTPSDDVGVSVASGDLNGDGVDDLIIGASNADSTPGDHNGATYVVYGHLADAPVNLTGTVASQTLAGSNFDDTLHGMDGNDTLYGNGGNDTLDGGNGTDIAAYSDATSGVLVNLNTPGAQAVGGGMGNDTLISIEGVRGSNFDDLLVANTGVNTFYGGAGDDGFYFGPNYTAADHVDGGAGSNDQIGLEGDYSLGITLTSASITNVEAMALLQGFNYTVSVDDSFLSAGQTFKFWSVSMGPANGVSIDCHLEQDGNFAFFLGAGGDGVIGGGGNDLFYGEGGGDQLQGGGGSDTFAYLSVTDSTTGGSNDYDIIVDFQAGIDTFKLPTGLDPTAFDKEIDDGSMDLAFADTDLVAAIGPGKLAPHHAIIFQPVSGSAAGRDFLIVDANGVAGYQSGQDFVFDVSGSNSLGALSISDFT